jgi:hypothetical protein
MVLTEISAAVNQWNGFTAFGFKRKKSRLSAGRLSGDRGFK